MASGGVSNHVFVEAGRAGSLHLSPEVIPCPPFFASSQGWNATYRRNTEEPTTAANRAARRQSAHFASSAWAIRRTKSRCAVILVALCTLGVYPADGVKIDRDYPGQNFTESIL